MDGALLKLAGSLTIQTPIIEIRRLRPVNRMTVILESTAVRTIAGIAGITRITRITRSGTQWIKERYPRTTSDKRLEYEPTTACEID